MEVENSEFGFLDVLILLAENLRLILLAPVVAGALAYGVSSLFQRSYVSQSVVNMSGYMPGVTLSQASSQMASLMVSPAVLDQAVEDLRAAKVDEVPDESARNWLQNRIKVAVGSGGLLLLEVSSHSPVLSQMLANAVIDAWLKRTEPVGRKRDELQMRLSFAQDSLATLKQLRDRLVRNGDGGGTRKETAALLAVTEESLERRLEEVAKLSSALEGIPRAVVQQPPSLPLEPSSPRKGLVALLAVVISGVVLIAGLLGRQVWRSARRDPVLLQKQVKLLAALKLRSADRP